MGRDTLPSKPVIGLLGGIGAGKSTVAAELGRLSCAVIDADEIGHELLNDPKVQARLRRLWGEAIFDDQGSVDRQALGKIVFSNPVELEKLNSLLHPLIGQLIEQRIAEARGDAGAPAVVLDAAVMLEAGWDKLCTELVFVQADEADRAERVRRKRGWDRRLWREREKMQISLDKKRQKCHYLVDNSSSLPHLGERIRKLFHQIVPGADRP